MPRGRVQPAKGSRSSIFLEKPFAGCHYLCRPARRRGPPAGHSTRTRFAMCPL